MAKKPENPKTEKPEPLEADAVHQETASEGFFAKLLDQFTTAWLFLTCIPLPGWWNKSAVKPEPSVSGEGTDKDAPQDTPKNKGQGMTPLADTVRAWPLVGIAVGALSGGALWVTANLGLHPLASSFAAMIVAALVTGAIHEDGLADVVDGFGGGDTKAKKLRIMRDSRIGAFGVMALVLMVGFKAGALSGFNGPGLAAAAILTAHVLSRAFLPMLMVALPPARKSGLAHGAGVPKTENAVMAAGIGVLVAILALGFGPGMIATAVAGLGVAGVGWSAKKHIQGITGDVLGAAQQISEALVLAAVAVALRTVFY